MIVAHKVQSKKHYEDALSVRRTVFIEEQAVPPDLEVDEFEDSAFHFVAYDELRPIGAGRFRLLPDAIAKVERICVLPDYRGKHIGNSLMDEIEKEAKLQGCRQLKLNSQTSAIPFYEKRHYTISSPEFMDAGIPHKTMIKEID